MGARIIEPLHPLEGGLPHPQGGYNLPLQQPRLSSLQEKTGARRFSSLWESWLQCRSPQSFCLVCLNTSGGTCMAANFLDRIYTSLQYYVCPGRSRRRGWILPHCERRQQPDVIRAAWRHPFSYIYLSTQLSTLLDHVALSSSTSHPHHCDSSILDRVASSSSTSLILQAKNLKLLERSCGRLEFMDIDTLTPKSCA